MLETSERQGKLEKITPRLYNAKTQIQQEIRLED